MACALANAQVLLGTLVAWCCLRGFNGVLLVLVVFFFFLIVLFFWVIFSLFGDLGGGFYRFLVFYFCMVIFHFWPYYFRPFGDFHLA